MASFMNTMFVYPTSPLHPFPHTPRPLPALHCDVLAVSESVSHLPSLATPEVVHQSPLQHRIRLLFNDEKHYSAYIKREDLQQRAPKLQAPHDIFSPSKPHIAAAQPPFRMAPGTRSNQNGPQADLDMHSNNNARARNGAFQPTKRARGTNSWQLKQFAEATLGSGSLRKVVQLPEGENREEWIAVNLVDFYNQINLLYGAITEFCSPTSCPEMKATDEFEYLWHDPPNYPKPTRVPAPTYIGLLLTWASTQLGNPTVFPTQPGVPFPENFEKTVRVLFKRLYRIYAHIYCHHYSVVRGLGLEAHLNTGFKHYVLFVEEFKLADEKGGKKSEWFGPLGELVESMLKSD